MKFAVASGKGGTGKTTVSVNMARVYDADIILADCDVEEPNAHLFLKAERLSEENIFIPIPHVDEARCIACGECSRLCEYSAIVTFGTEPLVFPEMCHGCGGCMLVCPANAISETNRPIGVIETSRMDNITLISGKLSVGVAMAPPLIRAVKSRLPKDAAVILDVPPGTSCPVMSAIRDSDMVLLVTEPTPFGLHDLILAVDTVKELNLPFGVIVNRMGSGDDRVHAFCRQRNIPILLEIPDDRRIAEYYSRGILIADALPEYRRLFADLIAKTLNSGKSGLKVQVK